jgi:hypothetical protein
MKTSIKFATGLILAAAALVASGSAALAGEGGAAGSVSIKFAGTFTTLAVPVGAPVGTLGVVVADVSRLSTSVAVGKSFAVATARTSGNSTSTSAIGSAGGFSISNAGTSFTATAETPALTAVDQLNNFDNTNGVTTLKPTTGVTLAD